MNYGHFSKIMDREVLCESLIIWVETFNLDVPHRTAEELSDGIAMARVLQQIAPDFFTDGWLGKVKTEDVTNWRLKVSNLKKILKGILEYNLEVLGIQIHDFQMPDVNAIGERSDHSELGRLLQLILGCAVNCSEKQEYIQRIMAMEESVQHVVMEAIQELMTKEMASDMDAEVGEQLKRTIEELNGAIEAKEELMQRCHELDLQVTSLMEEKQNVVLENDRLSERLNQAENLDDPSTPAGKRFQQIQHQLDQCQEENYKLETAKDDFRIKVDVLQKEVNEVKDKNQELTGLADECRGLKDELDDLRHTAEQVVKYEAQIESYKKKVDELSDLRGQVKLLEDKNTKYMQENLELQEEVRKSSSMKQQLEVYKKQNHELQSKLTDETKRADKADFEAKRMQEKMTTLQREKERIVTERDSLREVNEELKLTQLQTVETAGEDLSTSPGLEMLSMPPVIKEKMLRLEHENKMLKLKSSAGEADDQSQMLQTLLDDANARKNELETDLRLSNQKNMELEARVEDLQEMAKSTVSTSELIELRKKLDEQVTVTQQKDKLIHKERDNVSDVQSQLTAHTEEVERLREEMEKKEEEKRVMSENYRKYFDKARAVISQQEQKLSASGNNYPDVLALKQKLQEKDRYIEQLQKEQEKNKSTFEQEEKMMVSAWYNLGIQLHRQAAIDRLENTQGQAFLSRQRQVQLRGQQRIPNSHPNSSRLHLDASANQNKAGCDGCFSSLFGCVLSRKDNDSPIHSAPVSPSPQPEGCSYHVHLSDPHPDGCSYHVHLSDPHPDGRSNHVRLLSKLHNLAIMVGEPVEDILNMSEIELLNQVEDECGSILSIDADIPSSTDPAASCSVSLSPCKGNASYSSSDVMPIIIPETPKFALKHTTNVKIGKLIGNKSLYGATDCREEYDGNGIRLQFSMNEEIGNISENNGLMKSSAKIKEGTECDEIDGITCSEMDLSQSCSMSVQVQTDLITTDNMQDMSLKDVYRVQFPGLDDSLREFFAWLDNYPELDSTNVCNPGNVSELPDMNFSSPLVGASAGILSCSLNETSSRMFTSTPHMGQLEFSPKSPVLDTRGKSVLHEWTPHFNKLINTDKVTKRKPRKKKKVAADDKENFDSCLILSSPPLTDCKR